MSRMTGSDRRFFIVAGEASGDHHGAALMAAMKQLDPASHFAGIGGTQMQQLGLECLYDADDMALVGFSEVLIRLPFLLRAIRRTSDFARNWRPERAILIDYPGFNLSLARRLNQSGIPVTYYISPQLWAWREGRIKRIREYVDQLLVIFPFEVDWYRERGVTALFTGHPLLEEAPPEISRSEYIKELGLDGQRPVLTLFPGSRRQELQRHLILFADVSRLIKKEIPHLQVILGLADGLSLDLVPERIRHEMLIATNNPRLALRYADVAIVASGTATLEGAVWGVPHVVVYRVAPLSWWLGRRLVNLSHAGMVNILSREGTIPEFLQEQARADLISQAALAYFQDDKYRKDVLAKMAQVRQSLESPNDGEQGASIVAAQAIIGAE